MGSKYLYVRAVGQYDDNACWAACLEWWLKATGLGEITQEEVFPDYPIFRNGNGTIQREGLIQLIMDPRWYMRYELFYSAREFTAAKLKAHLAAGPVYIGYYDQRISQNHVNVIYGYSGSSSNPQVLVMEPMGEQEANGGYEGKHTRRRLSYYNARGEVFVGSPASYSGSGYDESYYH